MARQAVTKRGISCSRGVRPRVHLFGTHLSIAGGLHNALLAAAKLRCKTVQVFVKNQQQWRAPPLTDEAVELWHLTREAKRITGPVVAHASYLINLASADRQLRDKSRAAFADELLRCDRLGIEYLVVHPGAAGEQKPAQALRRVATSLNEIHRRHARLHTMTLLETTAGQGTALGRSFEELGEIIEHTKQATRVGVCVDTCHVFAAGYDLRDSSEYERMISSARRCVGLKRIRCWHLNDSLRELGAHRDRHAHIGHGEIGIVGFRHLLSDTRFLGVPMILETPKGQDKLGRDWDAVNLRRLRSMSTRLALKNAVRD